MSPIRREIIVFDRRLLERPPLWKRLLIALGAGVMIAASFMLGLVILSVVLGAAALAALIIAVRIWWVRRRLRNREPADAGFGPADDARLREWIHGVRKGGRVFDGESEDISHRR